MTRPEFRMAPTIDFDALFDSFRSTVARLETLPAYNVSGAEATRIQTWPRASPGPRKRAWAGPRELPQEHGRLDPELREQALELADPHRGWTTLRSLPGGGNVVAA